ncbi:AfsA-related hotdog domain-containing protein [Streptomyces sp. NPDC060077]|uniref:AfsA-related hotdog domain-containing protein n=1 Tax=Streptomyces sp. NPDC060077 TaxID=3347052 RepID=UPI0036572D35
MTVSTNAFASGVRELEFVRSVDRRLLHRRALSEVFLTDTAAVDGQRFLAGAELPSSHAYFTDHPGHTAVDPVLLLECARQAETYGAHRHLGVDDGTTFVLQSWSMRLPGLFTVRTSMVSSAGLPEAAPRERGGPGRGAPPPPPPLV